MKNAKSLPHESGIYKITNLINGHSYIGQAKDIYNRYNKHHQYDYKNEKYSTYPLYQALKNRNQIIEKFIGLNIIIPLMKVIMLLREDNFGVLKYIVLKHSKKEKKLVRKINLYKVKIIQEQN